MSRAVARWWNDYWFRPSSVFNLAVCRIAVVGLQLVLVLFPYALLTVPPYTRFEVFVALPDELWNPVFIFRLLTLPFGPDYRPTVAHLEIAYAIAAVAGILSFIGLFTRASLWAFVTSLIFIVAHSHSYGEFHHVETVSTIFLMLLAASPSGECLSIDDRLRRRGLRRAGEDAAAKLGLDRKSELARWPLVLMAWLFAMIYLSAALSKLGGSGLEWLNGHTLQTHLLSCSSYWGLELGTWIGQRFFLCWLLGWVSILFEATFFVVLIFPRLGWVYALLGAAFHIGIWMTMKAPFAIYLACYSVFFPWDRIATKLLGRRAG